MNEGRKEQVVLSVREDLRNQAVNYLLEAASNKEPHQC